MKITILGTAYPYRGGLATFNERLARQFMSEGHEVEIITFTLQYPNFLFPGKTQYSDEQPPQDLNIRRMMSSVNPLTWLRTGNYIRHSAPDLLISCYWMSFMAPCFSTIERIAARNHRTKNVALVHNMLPHEPSILDRLFAPSFVAQTDGFVALSDSVVKDIDRLDKKHKPKTFSPHPIYDHYGAIHSKNNSCEHLGLDPQYDYMLFFGLVRAYKGLDLLIRAFSLVADKLPNLRLLIAGEFYEDEEKYRTMITETGLEERVIINNSFIADSEIQYWFSAADIIVQPYKSATQSGVSQVAFHFEKPMLVTNVGGLGEIVHHGKMGYAVEPDANAIAHSLIDFYAKQRNETFIEYLKQEKQKYTWDKMTKQFINVKNEIEK